MVTNFDRHNQRIIAPKPGIRETVAVGRLSFCLSLDDLSGRFRLKQTFEFLILTTVCGETGLLRIADGQRIRGKLSADDPNRTSAFCR